jgi:hypothetical protein
MLRLSGENSDVLWIGHDGIDLEVVSMAMSSPSFQNSHEIIYADGYRHDGRIVGGAKEARLFIHSSICESMTQWRQACNRTLDTVLFMPGICPPLI